MVRAMATALALFFGSMALCLWAFGREGFFSWLGMWVLFMCLTGEEGNQP